MLRGWKIGGLMIGITLAGSLWARAETGYELFSWKSGPGWNFSVIEGTASARSRQVVTARATRLKNMTYLKGRIAALPSGERLYWKEDKRQGFVLPPQDVIREVDLFASSSHIMLLLPGQNSDSRVLKQLQDDAKEILDVGH